MGVMLHPNKVNPLRYRVQIKALGVNEYFSIVKHGSKKAERLAYERDAELKKILNVRRMQADLSINKLFAQDGSVKGLNRIWRERTNRKSYECFSLYANKSQTELVVREDNFEAAYEVAQEWLLKKYRLSSTYEIKKMFKKAKKFYWNSVTPVN
ncbi:MAG: hypothetical protein ACJAS1_003120 [Oleiphilaceae bacterium]|jgi:hypothetical protein